VYAIDLATNARSTFDIMPGGFHPPLSVVASWPQGNFENPVIRDKSFLITSIVLLIITIIVVAARLWVRFYLTRQGGIDDWLIILATVR
jgi:hypothetical protein